MFFYDFHMYTFRWDFGKRKIQCYFFFNSAHAYKNLFFKYEYFLGVLNTDNYWLNEDVAMDMHVSGVEVFYAFLIIQYTDKLILQPDKYLICDS